MQLTAETALASANNRLQRSLIDNNLQD